MSHTPQNLSLRRWHKSFTSFVALIMVTGLVATVPASALSYNTRPEVAETESVDGQTAAQEAIEADTAVSDAAITSLDSPEWPEGQRHLFDLDAAGPRAFSEPEDEEPVRVGAVEGEEFDGWDSPLPEAEESEESGTGEDGAREERRLPREPEEATGSEEGGEGPNEESAPEEPGESEDSSEEGAEDATGEREDEEEPVPEEVDEFAQPQPVGAAELEVLDRSEASELGLSGLALRLRRTDGVEEAGPVRVEVDYADFASAYGADYGSRLALIALTDCADGRSEGCLETIDLGSDNDTEAQTLTGLAPATGEGVLLAAAAGGDGEEGNGDYTATSLSPSSEWNVGPQTGDFSWSYPMAAPNVAGGLKPELSLSYSSQSVDGRTSGTNNQTSWIGEGFDYHPGYIERQYELCQNDGDDIPDLCWSRHNAILNLGGFSTQLHYIDGEWVLENDDGSQVERLTGTTNGDNDGEYWKVTTTDGTQYHFGLNQLPGHSSGDTETKSAWTVPVFGNDEGEPCYDPDLDEAWCDQAWRWNLDYAVDAQGNALAHYYEAETNNYGLNFDSDPVSYDRGGYLARTEYGLREDDPHATAPARVNYTVAERCLADDDFDCAEDERDEDNAEHWPDTPLDRACEDDCAEQHSPTFWTTKRLEQITTQVHDGDDYTTVDSWELEHAFPEPGDGTDPALWLESITHTGHTGEDTESTPAITFGGTPMPNRVDSTTDGLAPMNKWRITAVYTESGGQVDVNYGQPDCDPEDLPEPHENTQLCYPVIRTHNPGADEITDWFAKYPVTELVEVDLVGGQPDSITSYDYVGDPAWRYMDEDGFVDEDRRTWSQWRGFDRVIVRTGHEDEVRTETEYLFYQGMDGDHLPDEGTRSVQVTDSTGTTVDDDEVFNGQIREVIVREGVDGDVVSKTITTPWKRQTAERDFKWGTVEAHMVSTEQTDAYTALADGEFRQTRLVNSFDEWGMVDSVHDHGDVDVDGDERCTLTTYARNTDTHVLELVARTQKIAVSCDEDSVAPDEVIQDTRYLYDGQDFGDAPTQGLVTEVERFVDHVEDEPEYQTVTNSSFDSFGRMTQSTDAEGHVTTVDHTDLTPGGVTEQVVTTTPLGHEETVEFDHRSQPTVLTDADGNRTELAYDPLGRLSDVWLANRNRSANMSPSLRFEYDLNKDEPTTVTTQAINASGDYITSYQLLDGFLRERQTQEPAPGGGRVLTDVFYDTRGNTVIEREPYYNEDEPDGELFVVNNHDEIPRWTRTVYDGADRATDQVHMSRGVEQWRTNTEHHGDRTLVTEPEGGTGTTTITDVRGNTVEKRDHHGHEAVGDYDSTFYTYTVRDQLESITDPGDNNWTYTYDILGRLIQETDPDTGTSTTVYDDLDRPVQVTDARGESLHTTYDALGRQTHLREAAGDGPLRAEWVYDTVATGQLTSATRHEDGEEYASKVLNYNELGHPTVQEIHLPDVEGELAGSYRFTTLYNPDGSIDGLSMPAAGNLPAEGLSYGYDDLGNPTTLVGLDQMVSETVYSKVGNLVQRELGRSALGTDRTWITRDFDEKSNRLSMTSLVHQSGEGSLSTQTYDYDAAGNVLRIGDEPTDETIPPDVQCYEYDHLRRMTQVWTPDATGEEACAQEPDAQELGGAAPYWHSYTYDETGNRLEEVRHGPNGDIVNSYNTPEAGEGPAHAVTEVTQSGVSGDSVSSYDYDEAGNTTHRNTGGQDQTLEWGPEGELVSVTDGSESTEFVYDADGERLLRRANGATTLYLPGMEVTWDSAGGTEEATRYYTHAEETVAVRENDGTLVWMFSDHYGTGQISVDANWGNTVQRRMTAFGEDRGTTATWHGQRGFVGGTIDESIGLTQLGARSYDASLGRFLSVDPLLNQADSQQMHGYSYARNSPVTYTDADGLHPCACLPPGKGIGPGPGKSPGHNPQPPSRGSAIGTTIPGGGGGGGPIGGWGPSGGGGSSSGPTGVTPQPPYIEIDYVDLEQEALDEAGHNLDDWAPSEHWGECDTQPGVVTAGDSCQPTQSAKDGINDLIDKIPSWAVGPLNFVLTVLLVVAAAVCIGVTVGFCTVIAAPLVLAVLGALLGVLNYRLSTREEDRNLWDYFWNGLTGVAGGGALGAVFRQLGRKGWRVLWEGWRPKISRPPSPSHESNFPSGV